MRLVEFVGPSREDLRAFPATVRQDIGHALYQVQRGQTPDAVSPLHGFGTGVLEIRKTGVGGTYRTVYTVSLPSAIYVLHAFHKKSPRGSEMARGDQELIRSRLSWAQRVDAERQKEE